MLQDYSEYSTTDVHIALDQAHHDVFVKNFINDIALSLKSYGDSKGYKLDMKL